MIRILVILLALLSCSRRHVDREYRTFNVLADGTAIVTWWDRPVGHGLGRINKDGDLLWSVSLEGSPQQASHRAALLVADDIIAIRTYRQEGNRSAIQLEGISMRDGQRRWTTTLREHASLSESEDEGLDPDYWGHTVSDRFVVYLRRGTQDAATAHEVDARGGKQIRRAELELHSGSHHTLSWGDRVIIHDSMDNHDIILTGSDARLVEGHGVGCIVEGNYWRLVKADTRWVLSSLVEPAHRIELDVRQDYLSLGGCSRYRDSWVLVLDTGHQSELWILDTEGHALVKEPVGRRLVSPLADASTKFIPLLVDHLGRHELMMMDLEARVIAWRVDVGLSDETFRIGEQWYWISSDGQRLVQLDGADGRLVNAVRVDDLWLFPLRARNVAGDVMKLFRGTSEGIRVITIDMKTLKPATGHVTVRDARGDADLAALPRKMP